MAKNNPFVSVNTTIEIIKQAQLDWKSRSKYNRLTYPKYISLRRAHYTEIVYKALELKNDYPSIFETLK